MALIQISDIITATSQGDREKITKIKTEIAGADQYVGYTSFKDAQDSTTEWAVAKITAVGADETLAWAGGEPAQAFTWADRATHSYT